MLVHTSCQKSQKKRLSGFLPSSNQRIARRMSSRNFDDPIQVHAQLGDPFYRLYMVSVFAVLFLALTTLSVLCATMRCSFAQPKPGQTLAIMNIIFSVMAASTCWVVIFTVIGPVISLVVDVIVLTFFKAFLFERSCLVHVCLFLVACVLSASLVVNGLATISLVHVLGFSTSPDALIIYVGHFINLGTLLFLVLSHLYLIYLFRSAHYFALYTRLTKRKDVDMAENQV